MSNRASIGFAHDWPLVGRAEELDLLRKLRSGRRAPSIVISGPVGVGKSRLAGSALDAATDDGWATLSIRASAGLSAVPLAPFRAVLPADRAPGLAELVDAVAQQLIGLSTGKGLLLLVDDGQYLDDTSAGLIHQMVAANRLRSILTIRSGEQVPTALTQLWTDGLAERIELQNLSRSETSKLLSAALGGPVQGVSGDRIWHVTRGNPLYIREVVQSSLETGALSQVEGEWTLQGEWAAGSRLQEIVSSRMGRLDPDALSAIEALAMAGTLPLGLLTGLGTGSAVELLEARSLVTTSFSGRRLEVSIAHPLHAEVLRTSVPALRQRSLWRTLADAVGRTGARRSADRLRLACWSLEAGVDVDPITLAPDANPTLMGIGHAISARLHEIMPEAGPRHAERPPVRQDHDVAIGLARAAYKRTGAPSDGVALASALAWSGATRKAEAVLAEVALKAVDSNDRLRLTLALAFIRFWARLDVESSFAMLGDAAAAWRPDDDPRLLVEVYRDMASQMLQTAHPAAAVEYAERAAAREGVDLWKSPSAGSAAVAMSYLGRCREALALLDRASAEANLTGRARDVAILLMSRVGALTRYGDLEEARKLVDWLWGVALADNLLDAAGAVGVLLGEVLLRQGRPASAARVFRDSAGLLAERDILRYRPWALAGLARARALEGELSSGQSALEEARRARRIVRHFDLAFYLAEFELHQLAGDLQAALRAATEAARWARSTAMVVDEAQACDAWLSVERDAEPARRLRELAQATDSKLVALLADRADALMTHDPERLLRAAESFGAATAWAEAARTAKIAADEFVARGDTKSSGAALRAAEGWASRCEAFNLPGRERPGDASRLTAREREVAVFAAAGRTTREIAERMHLSTRTVENHLYRAYMKLGVSHRDALAAALSSE